MYQVTYTLHIPTSQTFVDMETNDLQLKGRRETRKARPIKQIAPPPPSSLDQQSKSPSVEIQPERQYF